MIGRPPKFTSPAEFLAVADAYFAKQDALERPYTVNGLALALGMCRQSLLNYGQNPDFLDAVKEVRAKLEDHWESRLGGPNAAGTIFWLKNQGWSDRTEQQISGPNGGPVETVQRIERVIHDPTDSNR